MAGTEAKRGRKSKIGAAVGEFLAENWHVLAVALVLRVPGIWWGLPGPSHLFSYHPDEYHSLRGAFSLALGDPNPHFFNYGCLYLYAVAATCFALHSTFFMGFPPPALTFSAAPLALRAWTLDARLATLAFSLATVAALCWLGRRMGLGALPGLLLALFPLHSLHSRYATVDVPQAFFVAAAMGLTFAGLKEKRPRLLIWAGAAAGLAGSVKYNGFSAILMPLVAMLQFPHGKRLRPALGAIAAAAIAFALTSPYVILAWPEAKQHILFEIRHMREGEYPARVAEPLGSVFHLKWLLIGTGGLAALVFWPMRRREEDRLLAPAAVWALAWFAMISLAGVRYARYEVPLLPALAVFAAAAWRRSAWARRVGIALAGLAALGSCHISARLCLPDSRDAALRWLLEHSAPAEQVAFNWQPWFQVPPVDYCNGGEALRANPVWRQFIHSLRPLVIADYDIVVVTTTMPEWFIWSEFEMRDFLRAGDEKAQALADVLRQRWRVVADFSTFPRWTLLPRWLNPPQDWMYPSPPLRLMRLQAGRGAGGGPRAGRPGGGP